MKKIGGAYLSYFAKTLGQGAEMARIDHEPLKNLRRCTFRLSEPVSTHDMFPFQEVSHCSTDKNRVKRCLYQT